MLRTLSESVLQIETAVDNLLVQIKEMRNNVFLLQSISGIGSHSEALLLGEIGDISLFKKPKQLVAYFGLDPTERQSGSFRGTKNKISKRGSPYARAALHMGIVNSICKRGKDSAANPVLLSYYEKSCKILVGNTQTLELHPLDAGLASPNEKVYGSNTLSAIGKQLFPVKKENSND